MITYIYFVKCPNCEDEHFDFFDEAKAFAMSCLSQKPVITQTEVCRNDFGECTEHCDLGTVWSWEDVMKDTYTDAEPATSIFTKDDFTAFEGDYNPENDPEFYEMDNSVDCKSETSEVSPVERKPIPEGMTIEQLVEEMEENEDMVECTWCNDLFDKSECRKELNLGWLCRRCADDLTARGEGPVFKEDNYWDFLDEVAELKEASLSDIAAAANSEFGSSWNADDLLDFAGVEDRYDKQSSKPVVPKTPKSMWVLIKPNPPIEVPAELIDCVSASDSAWAYRILRSRHGDWYNKGWKILPFEDACKRLSKEDCERAKHMDEALSENAEPEELHDLGNEYDGGYPAETPEVSDSHLKLCPECGEESFDIETGICVACGFN